MCFALSPKPGPIQYPGGGELSIANEDGAVTIAKHVNITSNEGSYVFSLIGTFFSESILTKF